MYSVQVRVLPAIDAPSLAKPLDNSSTNHIHRFVIALTLLIYPRHFKPPPQLLPQKRGFTGRFDADGAPREILELPVARVIAIALR